MNPEVADWVSQIPWLPLGAVVIALLWVATSGGRQRRRQNVEMKIAEGALVVDVRSPSEFAAGHYPGAVNHPVEKLATSLKRLGDPNHALVVHCASGARSARAAKVLLAAGFTDVTDAGGLANLPH